MAQKFGRWVKIQPLSKNSIFDSISSKYYYIFETLPVPKFLKTPDFFNVSYGKNTRNKTVLIFGPFPAISGKILPKFCHRFVRPLGPFCVMQPKNQPVGNTANWRNSSGNSLQVSILLLPPLSPLTSLRGINISAGKGICEKGNSAGIRLAWGVGGGGVPKLLYVYCILHGILFPFLSSFLFFPLTYRLENTGKQIGAEIREKFVLKKILLQ
jgi:hypothetical protein